MPRRREMKVTLFAGKLPERSATANSEAHNLYLEGRYFLERRTKEDYEKALVVQKALSADRVRARMGWARLGLRTTNGTWADARGVRKQTSAGCGATGSWARP